MRLGTAVVRSAILLSVAALATVVSVSAGAAASLAPGAYVGTLTIRNLSGCEEFAFEQLNSPPGDATTTAELTVSADGASLVIEGSAGNTRAGDYFETNAGTLTVTDGRLVGGVRHASLYYFEMALAPAVTGKGYTGSGTWIFQDQCEGQAPSYQATLDLAPAGAEAATADSGGSAPAAASEAESAPAPEISSAGKDIVDLDESGAKPEKGW